MNSLLERPIADLASEPRPLPSDRYSPLPTFHPGHGKEAQPAAYDRNGDIAQNPGREQRKPDNLHCQRKGVVEYPHQHQKNETQDFTDGERDKNEGDDDHVVKATAEAAFHDPYWAMIIGHGARFRADKGDRAGSTNAFVTASERPRGARTDVTFAFVQSRAATLDVDQWPTARGWAEQTHGPIGHEECKPFAFIHIATNAALHILI